MLPLALFLLLVSSLVYYTISTIINKRRHAKRAEELGCKPPQRRPHKLPFGIDLVRDLMKADAQENVPGYLLTVRDGLGVESWVQHMLGTDIIATAEPKNIQAMLATQFNDFSIGEQRRGAFFPMLGNGIFTSDGKSWEHSRALLRPQFARDQVADLDVEEHHVQDLLMHLPTDASDWTGHVDLSPLFFRLTLDSATEFLFGQSVGSQIAALSDHKHSKRAGELDWTTFGPAFDAGTMAIGYRSRLAELYSLYNPKSFRDNCKEVHRFADHYVNLALKTDLASLGEKELEDGQKKPKYIFLQELVKTTRDPIELRSQLLNILLAGRDTTAGLLGWTYYCLARHPQIFEKLRQEVLDQFGTYQKPRNISFSALKSCSYLQWVLNETLRLYATVPFNSRRATRDTTLPLGGGPDQKSPIYVRKGQEVNYAVHLMHHRADIWGPDVDEFKPERWANRKAGWEYLPFNGGPRICLGQQHALTLAGFTVVRMMQKFDKLEPLDSDPYTKHHYSVTTSPAHCSVRLHEASL